MRLTERLLSRAESLGGLSRFVTLHDRVSLMTEQEQRSIAIALLCRLQPPLVAALRRGKAKDQSWAQKMEQLPPLDSDNALALARSALGKGEPPSSILRPFWSAIWGLERWDRMSSSERALVLEGLFDTALEVHRSAHHTISDRMAAFDREGRRLRDELGLPLRDASSIGGAITPFALSAELSSSVAEPGREPGDKKTN